MSELLKKQIDGVMKKISGSQPTQVCEENERKKKKKKKNDRRMIIFEKRI